jgi:hypothetical protein
MIKTEVKTTRATFACGHVVKFVRSDKMRNMSDAEVRVWASKKPCKSCCLDKKKVGLDAHLEEAQQLGLPDLVGGSAAQYKAAMGIRSRYIHDCRAEVGEVGMVTMTKLIAAYGRVEWWLDNRNDIDATIEKDLASKKAGDNVQN